MKNNVVNKENSLIRSGALGVLFLAVFIDLFEFGVIIPFLPFWTLRLSGQPFVFGILASVYSFMSFVLAPVWGKISDARGRRPVILAGLVGTVLSLGILLVAAIFIDSLFMLFASRIIGGFFTAATLPTSQAYIADTTAAEQRAKGFGLIGAAFGLGFALGPGIGGVLTAISGGYALPIFVATVLSVINLGAGIKYLPESLTKEARDQRSRLKSSFNERYGRIGIRKVIIENPKIIVTIILFAGVSLAFSGMQSTLALLGESRFALNESQSGYIFFVVGIIAIVTQAGIIRPISKRFADTILIASGLLFLIVGFIGLSSVTSLISMVIWVIPLAFGSSIANPTLGAFLSKETPVESSGAILGLNQGMGSFMRIIGPLIATALFEFNVAYPYYLGAMLLSLSFILAVWLVKLSKERLPEIPCLNCGHVLQEGVAICQKCGYERAQKLVTGYKVKSEV